jgi:hypothetical protein
VSLTGNLVRLLWVLGAMILPTLLIHQVFSEEQGTYRSPPGLGTRALNKGNYEKLHSREWLSKAVEVDLAAVKAEIAQLEGEILQEKLRVAAQ